MPFIGSEEVDFTGAVYLAVDPGEGGTSGGTGYATFLENGDIQVFGTCKGRIQVYELLAALPSTIKRVFMEDFSLYSWKAIEQSGSKFETVRVIGAIECHFYCFGNIPVVLQTTENRDTGYLWAGIKKATRKSLSHERDAYAHGVYGLQKMGIRRPQQARTAGR